jgi:hypothetical protein
VCLVKGRGAQFKSVCVYRKSETQLIIVCVCVHTERERDSVNNCVCVPSKGGGGTHLIIVCVPSKGGGGGAQFKSVCVYRKSET